MDPTEQNKGVESVDSERIKSEVITLVKIHTVVSWVMPPCSLVCY